MELALYDPSAGYYAGGKVRFGRAGDFYTNPTVSRLFGEAVARFLIPALRKMLRPMILELGPGDGHLARDVLNTLRAVAPDVYEDTRFVLLERSARLQDRQLLLLRDHQSLLLFIRGVAQLEPAEACVVIANEFFDAFPARRWRWSPRVFAEMMVSEHHGEFVWSSRSPEPAEIPPIVLRISEIVPAGTLDLPLGIPEFLSDLARRVGSGILLFFDYGDTALRLAAGFPEGTLRAQTRHAIPEDPLAEPGDRDLSVYVPIDLLLARDPREIAATGEPVLRTGPYGSPSAGWQFAYYPTQAEFLMKTTFPEVLKNVHSLPDGQERFQLQMQARTLVNPEGIGGAMFALALASPAFLSLLPI
jgi:SAM-dependent MidA family methyltransferase